MKIELKILNKEFYKAYESNNDRCSYTECGTLPHYATSGSAAVDLVATQDYTIYPGEVVEIRTGLAIHIGSGLNQSTTPEIVEGINRHMGVSFAGLILPRSGLGSKGLILANTVGLLDEDYQGEIVVKAWNRREIEQDPDDVVRDFFKLEAGDRFAQLLFLPIIKPIFEIVENFSSTTSRKGGFGSTDDNK